MTKDSEEPRGWKDHVMPRNIPIAEITDAHFELRRLILEHNKLVLAHQQQQKNNRLFGCLVVAYLITLCCLTLIWSLGWFR